MKNVDFNVYALFSLIDRPVEDLCQTKLNIHKTLFVFLTPCTHYDYV